MDVFDEYIERYSNWGRWGQADQRGTANLITPDLVRDATRHVEHGRVVPLGIEFNQLGPQTGANGRFNCLRYSIATGTDHTEGRQLWGPSPIPRQMGYADDVVHLHLQSATHWDSLCHIFHRGKMYNGFPADEVTSIGAARNGTEALKASLVGRAVLLDIPAAKGVESLDDGYAITIEDLDAAAELESVEVRRGDIVLLRTGQLGRCLKDGWGTYAAGDAPGLSFYTLPWIHERGIAAIASDTWGVEVRPNDLPDSFQPFHVPAIVYMGLALGEIFNFERLAEECATLKRFDMLVIAPPLAVTGSAGAPPCPVAIL
jgi:kynurenine formamidase